MPLETQAYDTAEHLRSAEDIVLYIEAVLEDGDPALFAAAIDDVARARGMAQIAQEAGLSREALDRALSEPGSPHRDALAGVLRAVGAKLGVAPAAP